MVIFIVNWIERENKRLATSSYSSAFQKYKELLAQTITNDDITIAEPDQAIQRVELKGKKSVISLINGE